MIDVFIRRVATTELMHPRVTVVQVRDHEQAVVLLETMEDLCVPCAARPARRRAAVAELVAARDARIERELSRLMVSKRRAALRAVPG